MVIVIGECWINSRKALAKSSHSGCRNPMATKMLPYPFLQGMSEIGQVVSLPFQIQ